MLFFTGSLRPHLYGDLIIFYFVFDVVIINHVVLCRIIIGISLFWVMVICGRHKFTSIVMTVNHVILCVFIDNIGFVSNYDGQDNVRLCGILTNFDQLCVILLNFDFIYIVVIINHIIYVAIQPFLIIFWL